jgi:hypothetical protein
MEKLTMTDAISPSKSQNNGIKRDKNGRFLPGTAAANPAGRPPLGESWREIFDKAGRLTKQQLLDLYPVFGRRLEGLPADVPLRDAVALSALVTLACEPSPGLLSAIMERVDGKVTTPIEIRDWREAAKQAGVNPDEVENEIERIIKSKMAGRGDSGGVGEGDTGNSVDAAPADAAPATGEVH